MTKLEAQFFKETTVVTLPWRVLKPGTELNETPCNFLVINGKFQLQIGIQKSRFLGLGRDTVWLQGEESGKEWNGLVHSVSFRSGF